jgi:hypothetical protein
MYCAKCGKTIPGDSVFCPECGYNLVTVGPAASSPAVAAEPAVSEALNIGTIVGSIILPLIGIIMGIIYLRDGNPAKKKAGKTWLWVGIGAAGFWLLVNLA